MRRIVALVWAAAMVLAGCGRANLDVGSKVMVPPIPDGETVSYRILNHGTPTGLLSMVTSRGEFRDEPVLRVDIVAVTTADSAVTLDSSVVFLTRDSLAPVTTFRFVKVSGQLAMTTAANYMPDSAAVSAYVLESQQQSQQFLPVDRRTYDADELSYLGRGLLLTPGRAATIRVLNPAGPPFGGTVIEARVAPGADEEVTVPAGRFDCYSLVMELGSQRITFWYERAGSHRLVRYEAREADVVMELLARPAAPTPASRPRV